MGDKGGKKDKNKIKKQKIKKQEEEAREKQDRQQPKNPEQGLEGTREESTFPCGV